MIFTAFIHRCYNSYSFTLRTWSCHLSSVASCLYLIKFRKWHAYFHEQALETRVWFFMNSLSLCLNTWWCNMVYSNSLGTWIKSMQNKISSQAAWTCKIIKIFLHFLRCWDFFAYFLQYHGLDNTKNVAKIKVN